MKLFFAIVSLCLSFNICAQSKQKSSSELYNDLKRLSNSATVMYVAAHPDDENTRMISWLTHAKHVNTVYLSLTRGDGGQNLIGTEKGDLLGVLRTQELLEARKIDKGQQWFTRAVDFGYSKTAIETLSIWDKEKILGDVVWAIRYHQPDVIITRFDPDSNGRTHGHHTASAMLAVEAFDLANDPSAYPEQLKYVQLWQPRRLFFNTSWWFYGSRENFEKADKSKLLSVDVGEYYPTLGMSNNEIASLSRSKHACQGFGSALQRGSQEEWLKLLKGDMPTNGDLLQGIDQSWNRYAPGLASGWEKIFNNFDFKDTEKTANDLLAYRRKHYSAKQAIPLHKHEDFRELVLDALGIYIEWTTNTPTAIENDQLVTNLEITNRSSRSIVSDFADGDNLQGVIQPNEKIYKEINSFLPTGETALYWLKHKKEGIGLYHVSDKSIIGFPELKQSIQQEVPIYLDGENISVSVPLKYKTVDPAVGEIYEPFYIVPPVAINFKEPVYLFSGDQPQIIEVDVKSFTNNVSGTVQINAGLNWMTSQEQPFSISNKGETQTVSFTVIPPKTQEMTELRASARVGDESYFQSFLPVDYNHINKQYLFQDAIATIGRLGMKVPKVSVGYIQGSGDVVPNNLRNVGLQVEELPLSKWAEMENFDVIMVGIRAFNTLENSDVLADKLKAFAINGGTVIVQYQTSRGLKTTKFAPYSLTLGRDRISQEDAELKMLNADHPIFNTPNQITENDFDNWVQERGLYFANEWSDEYKPLLAGNDLGESEKQGILLVADIGEGQFIYTGLSFFRELPAGVPGAYRLMMNLLALGEH